MCGQGDLLLDRLPATDCWRDPLFQQFLPTTEADSRLEPRNNSVDRVAFRDYVIVSGRRWGKSRNHDIQWLFWPFELPPDDRPIGEVVYDHFRQRFEGGNSAPDDFQDLYAVPGAF